MRTLLAYLLAGATLAAQAIPGLIELRPIPWRVSASHNNSRAAMALGSTGWTSGLPQASGMWFQIELPEAVLVAEIRFDSRGTASLASRAARGAPASPGAGPPIGGWVAIGPEAPGA